MSQKLRELIAAWEAGVPLDVRSLRNGVAIYTPVPSVYVLVRKCLASRKAPVSARQIARETGLNYNSVRGVLSTDPAGVFARENSTRCWMIRRADRIGRPRVQVNNLGERYWLIVL